jgi:hypothetical protein
LIIFPHQALDQILQVVEEGVDNRNDEQAEPPAGGSRYICPFADEGISW